MGESEVEDKSLERIRAVSTRSIQDELLEFAEDASVLPMYMSESDTDPTTEVIVCTEISGGANFVDGMPKELTLVRKVLNGEEHKAGYVIKK